MFIPLSSITDVQTQSAALGRGLQKVEQWLPLYLTPKRPTTYTLELIASCNHECVGCGNVFSRQLKFMPASTWLRLLERLRGEIVSLRITGGECTLHPGFAEIIQAVDSLSVPFVVFTNGRWRKPDAVISLFADCKYLDGLLISLHGSDPDSYRAFVVTDSFDIVIRNIQRATQAGLRVGTNTILLKSNVDQIEDIARLSFSLGAQSAAFSRYYGHSIPSLELSELELHNAIHRIAQLREAESRVVFNNCVPMCFSDVDIPTKGCTSGFTHCTIDPLGNARPCTHSPFMLGNVLEQDISAIWDSAPLWEWRNLVPESCTGCGVFNKCRGGCRATAYHQGLAQDALIRSPFERLVSTPPKQIRLYRHLRPVPNYTLRQDDFGFYLINRNRHLAVSEKAKPILDMIDGQTSLEQIQSNLGSVAVDFIGSLVLHGLVKLSPLVRETIDYTGS